MFEFIPIKPFLPQVESNNVNVINKIKYRRKNIYKFVFIGFYYLLILLIFYHPNIKKGNLDIIRITLSFLSYKNSE